MFNLLYCLGSMHLPINEIHVWSTDLMITDEQEKLKFLLLNDDEKKRAGTFLQPLSRKHFIAARSALREILSLYLSISPEKILFTYTAHKKPYLHASMDSSIKFNLSHSHHLAVYAFTLNDEIGIDLEKIDNNAHMGVAKKYFNKEEIHYMMQLPETDRANAFYRIWAAKEAVVKAIGKGIALSLADIAISPQKEAHTLSFENKIWQVTSLPIHVDYQCALAGNLIGKSISFWNFFDQTHHPTNQNKSSQL